MYSANDLYIEVCEIIDRTVAKGDATPASWLAKSVMSGHVPAEGEDADFYMTCARDSVRRAVQSALSRYKPKENAADNSLILPGFDFIQCAYSVKRETEQVVVPVGKMTLDEINEKISEIEAMGRGCFQHAKELQRYRDDKFSAPRLGLVG